MTVEFVSFSSFSDVRGQVSAYMPPTFVAKLATGVVRITKVDEGPDGYGYEVAFLPQGGGQPVCREGYFSGFGTGGENDVLCAVAEMASNGSVRIIPHFRA